MKILLIELHIDCSYVSFKALFHTLWSVIHLGNFLPFRTLTQYLFCCSPPFKDSTKRRKSVLQLTLWSCCPSWLHFCCSWTSESSVWTRPTSFICITNTEELWTSLALDFWWGRSQNIGDMGKSENIISLFRVHYR